jgi:hypothetical protein
LEDRCLPSTLTSYGQLPLAFEANVGQADSDVRYLAHGPGYNLALTDTGAVLALTHGDLQDVLRLQLVGANATPTVVGLGAQAGHANYLLGNDPTQWQTDVALYDRVAYEQVYPGVDLVFYGNDQDQLEYDLDVKPGTDPNAIALQFNGASSMMVDSAGDLVLHMTGGDVVEHAPVLYQEVGGVRQPVTGAYELDGDGTVRLRVGAYDASQALVIDPTLVYSSYLGGSAVDVGEAVAVDASGNVYLTGYTASTDFPTVSAFQASNHGGPDAFVVKLNAAGALVYATYLGGSGNDEGYGIAVDGNGSAYITGYTDSTNFPTANAYQATNHGGTDAFVVKLNAAGNGLAYSTYLGGSSYDVGYGIAVDSSGNAYVTGQAYPGFPTVSPLQGTIGGFNDAFVTKMNATGGVVYSTFLGGSNSDVGLGIALDGSNNVYVTGYTQSTNFPTHNAIQPASGGEVTTPS